jgi:alkyl hydroperoxide reductase subunit AhpF
MTLFSEDVIRQTREVLKGLRDPVTLTAYSQKTDCDPCAAADAFAEELTAIDDRLLLEKKDFLQEKELAEKVGIHHVPALVLHRPGDGRPAVRYYGVPGGHEFGALLRVLVQKDINLKVFVLTTCPSCPVMAHLGAALAYHSPRITTEIIEANTFVDLAERFTVGTVPKIVINDAEELVGILPPEELVRRILAA